MTTIASSRHSSESEEHYTPPTIVEAARLALGGFDLDPASCDEANMWIKSPRIFTQEDDGFTRPWWGRVFLNPPGGLSDDQQRRVKGKCRETGSCGLPIGHTHSGVEASQKKWWFKLSREFAAGRVKSAIFVCFSVELLQNAQVKTPVGLTTPLDHSLCFPARRVAYVKPGGEVGVQPPHASCIVYMGTDQERFADAFRPIGRVLVGGTTMRNGHANGATEKTKVLSKNDLLKRIDRGAQAMLGVSRVEAFKMLDRGDLRGTIAADELTGLRMLLVPRC